MALPKLDPNLFLILKILDSYGHEKMPLKIVKERQSYVVGHEHDVSYSDGRGGVRKVFSQACKITFVKSTGEWKLYWQRATGQWNLYEVYESLEAAMREVKDDPSGCFWG